ncbi:phytanoyl-CoA dioxygenase [Flavobacterium album]|uniref:Phytanoyl-CoA dioxygenase n=1 Tax=Flavobacterium album TaxID=2175091 RepID=A0A2S1R0P2_9FLAO|nr:phytanoyl-CoA dioxygenase family protein [Flavobacterium album]AWH86091.1 phytanoyl-CoA dioxygenase [Flavobacterium album]
MNAVTTANATQNAKKEIRENGFSVIEGIYDDSEIQQLLSAIENVDTSGETFRKSANLFAIRQFLKEIPETLPLIFTDKLKHIIKEICGESCFVVKSIFFDKPGESNWFVAYHQDLTISVAKRIETENFGPWTVKQGQFAVQPPLDILEDIFTIRIHLDEANENNGALKVIEKSHSKGIYRPETIDWQKEKEITCNVPKGGIMLMKPLLLHSSGRTTNNARRRVIHIEFSNKKLPGNLQWSEKTVIPC